MKIKGFEIGDTSPGKIEIGNVGLNKDHVNIDDSIFTNPIIVPDLAVPEQEAINASFEFIHYTDAPNSYRGVKGYFKYTGTDTTVTIPTEINGHILKDTYRMFRNSFVEKVINTNPNITNMSEMFFYSRATTLDLSDLDTSNVTDMASMFSGSPVTTLDLSSFSTSNVTDMSYMFSSSKATELVLSSFNTSNVTNMDRMFFYSRATTLDLSSFNTSKVTDMDRMFSDSPATTLDLSSFNTSNVTDMFDMFSNSKAITGFARTLEDADRFNNTSDRPDELTFTVK